jgi:hypothetical protein
VSFGKSLIAGLACGLLLAFIVGQMMLDNNNQGEFANVSTGQWTTHFWGMLALITLIGAFPVTLFATIIGWIRRPGD